MGNPFISCQCVTYARVERLEEAIACFLCQTVTDSELVILNTFPLQKLSFNHPRVRIINLETRPPCLGAARNSCVPISKAGRVVIWDDDDLYLPHHLETFARHFGQNQWLSFVGHFQANNFQIKGVGGFVQNQIGYTKEAWWRMGGYGSINSGEDRDFNDRLRAKCRGRWVHLKPDELSFIMSWNNGVCHISGLGEDKAGEASGYDRVANWVRERVATGAVRTGNIVLRPRLSRDWSAMAKGYLAQMPAKDAATCPT